MTPLRLGMITQTLNEDDPVLGFTVGWVRALAAYLDRLHVFCLRTATPSLPTNVETHVMSRCRASRYIALGAELRRLARQHAVDAVLAHMCPRYAVAASLSLPKRVPITMWYAHSSVTASLRLAHRVCARIYSCSTESYPIRSPKLEATGHGIDTDRFRPSPLPGDTPLRIVAVGRIARSKHLDLLVEAIARLQAEPFRLRAGCRIVGTPATKPDIVFDRELRQRVAALHLDEEITFVGPIPYPQVAAVYCNAHVLFNGTVRHSLDKAALEAMACGRLVLTTNDAFAPLFGSHAQLLIARPSPDDVAATLAALAQLDRATRAAMADDMSSEVRRHHSLATLAQRLAQSLAGLAHQRSRSDR